MKNYTNTNGVAKPLEVLHMEAKGFIVAVSENSAIASNKFVTIKRKTLAELFKVAN